MTDTSLTGHSSGLDYNSSRTQENTMNFESEADHRNYLNFVRGTLEIMVRKGKMTQAEADEKFVYFLEKAHQEMVESGFFAAGGE